MVTLKMNYDKLHITHILCFILIISTKIYKYLCISQSVCNSDLFYHGKELIFCMTKTMANSIRLQTPVFAIKNSNENWQQFTRS